eukprot:scaffold187082_cov28-Attheya_sp.AAC.1
MVEDRPRWTSTGTVMHSQTTAQQASLLNPRINGQGMQCNCQQLDGLRVGENSVPHSIYCSDLVTWVA